MTIHLYKEPYGARWLVEWFENGQNSPSFKPFTTPLEALLWIQSSGLYKHGDVKIQAPNGREWTIDRE